MSPKRPPTAVYGGMIHTLENLEVETHTALRYCVYDHREQGWCSDESIRLLPMWLGIDSRTRRHMWVEFVVGSLLCSKRFFSGYSGFPLSSKKPTFPNSNSIQISVNEYPLCGGATSNSHYHYYYYRVSTSCSGCCPCHVFFC